MQSIQRSPLKFLLAVSLGLVTAQRLTFSYAQAPHFQIYPLGFLDAAHTDPELGVPSSSILAVASGIGIAGTSDQFLGPGETRSGRSAWFFDLTDNTLTRAGLFDSAHTSTPENEQDSRFAALNLGGQGIGSSQRYDESSDSGISAWIFHADDGRTDRIGLYSPGAAGPFSDNRLRDFAVLLNAHGDVAGHADFNTSGGPQYAWLYDSVLGATQQIGLLGEEYQDEQTGLHESHVEFLTPSRHVVGTSLRHGVETGSGSSAGQAAWQFDAQTGITTRIGFFDAAHTRPDGKQFSAPELANDSGLVVGTSEFLRDGTNGHSGWVYDPSTHLTQHAGLAESQSNDPAAFLLDYPLAITNSEKAFGHSLRYIAGYEHKTPWVYDHNGGQTTPVGLFDPEHTRVDGGTTNEILHRTADVVVGTATRWGGEVKEQGNSIWWHDANTGRTERIGLFDANYTTSDGKRDSRVVALNGLGMVAGYSTRYVGTSILRQMPWIFDPATNHTEPIGEALWATLESTFNRPVVMNGQGQVAGTSRNGPLGELAWYYGPAGQGELFLLGLFDERHQELIGFDTFQFDSSVHGINENGNVVGFSQRYDVGGSHPRGQSAWFFDPEAEVIYSLVFSESPSGDAFTTVRYLGEDGSVVGEYDRYAPSGEVEGRRPFYWSPAAGFWDFESLILGGLSAAGWESLGEALTMVDSNTFVGRGLRTGSGDVPFALVADTSVRPPHVAQVLGGATTWTGAFQEVLGSTAGFYPIATDQRQLEALPWSIDEIRVVFSEDVNVSQNDLQVVGVGTESVEVEAFEYESTSRTATWTIEPIWADKLLLVLSDHVTSTSTGLRLDGEHVTGSGLPRSGDGVEGGEFAFRFNVLVGDADGNGSVSLNDLQTLAAYWGESTDLVSKYTDFDGSGALSLNDLQLLAAFWGASLPTDEPGLAPAGASVPEPSAHLMFIVGGCLIMAARRLS